MAGRRRASSMATLEREKRAVEMRRERYTYAQIAASLSLSTQGAWKMVQRAYKRVPAGQVEALRLEDGDMLDRLHHAHWHAALDGDIEAAKVILKIADQRAKLFGLNAPVKVDATLRSKTDAEIEELVNELASLPPAPKENA